MDRGAWAVPPLIACGHVGTAAPWSGYDKCRHHLAFGLFVSASMNGRNRGGAEFGVLLRGPGIVEDFQGKLEALGVFSEHRGGDRPPPGQGRRRRRRRGPRGRVGE